MDVEGKKLGFDKDLTLLLARCARIPVTYAGGISGLLDLEEFAQAGKGKINATIGSALDIFGGPMSYEETVRWFMKRKVSIDLHS